MHVNTLFFIFPSPLLRPTDRETERPSKEVFSVIEEEEEEERGGGQSVSKIRKGP